MTDADKAAELAALMTSHPGVVIQLDAYQAFTLAAALQLANRHPGVAQSQLSETLRGAVRSIQDGLGEPLASIIEAGWDPNLDVSGAL
jgi:hypothetical protein